MDLGFGRRKMKLRVEAFIPAMFYGYNTVFNHIIRENTDQCHVRTAYLVQKSMCTKYSTMTEPFNVCLRTVIYAFKKKTIAIW